MSTILLVEDNPHIMRINENALSMQGYSVLKARSAAECEALLSSSEADLIVLDVMLPDGNGIELCRKLKRRYDIPILFLSALGENADIIEGLRSGGDDYLPKPYDLEVLLARIEARLRSSREGKRFLNYNKLRLDTVSMCAYFDRVDLLLTQKEFLILMMLVQNAEQPVKKGQLYSGVWGSDMTEDSSALYTAISRVKKKLTMGKTGITISSHRAEGYMLERE